ncbi:hypothetical protein SAMN05428988_3369 [Chitinophaga sp. YR573]|uniref:hypothetical protein n=1 Tax=Chitinophaga sp. YR573 TaxID=1881040 RepID=UPI0008B8AC05|nr:hypothetical protein [Chitinophaga sp. YR573]SEW22840.1 hypothetical protein SAMN05428988_3369 [Chitinophaga sp. YR573]
MKYFKRHMYCLFSLLLLSLATQAQTLKDFYNNDTIPLTYLGVDFSLAKVQGETAVASQMRDKFEEINNVITNEQKKYDIAGSFRRDHVMNELSVVNKLNVARNTETLKVDDEAAMEKDSVKIADIAKHVKSYELSGKKGIGLVFIMDGMSKLNKEATMYVTLLNLSNKKVLFTERMTGKAQGFGFRNYWAYTVYKVLHSIDKDDYSDWKKEALAAPDAKEEPVEQPKKDTLKTTKPPKAKKVVKKGE